MEKQWVVEEKDDKVRPQGANETEDKYYEHIKKE